MKDSIKRLRIEMTAGGLQYIKQAANGLLRKDFFIPAKPPKSDAEKNAFVKESMAKAWQTGTLERLIQSKVLKHNVNQQKHEVYYTVDDEELLNRIIADYKNDGQAVAHFVFPNEVPYLFGSLPTETVSEGIESASESVEAVSEGQAEVSFEDLVVAMAGNVVEIKKSMTIHANHILELNKFIVETHEAQSGFLKELASYLRSETPNTKIHSVLATIENRQHGSNKRLDELDGALKSQRQLLDSNQTTMKKVADSVEKIVEAAAAILPLRATLTESTESVNNLVKEIKFREKSSLNNLAERVAKLSEESKNLAAALLEAAVANVEHNIAE